MCYLLGILTAITSGLVFTFSSMLQKRAMRGMDSGGPLEGHLLRSPLWLLDFAGSFILGAPLNMAAYVVIGPTLPPALGAAGLAAVPVAASWMIGERQGARSWTGAFAISLGVAAVCLSGLAIAPEQVDWLEPAFLRRAALVLGGLGALAVATLGLRRLGAGPASLHLALVAGIAQGLVNAQMASVAGQIGRSVTGRLNFETIFVAGDANAGAIFVGQLALKSGPTSSVIPV
jgi:hypothetical protein